MPWIVSLCSQKGGVGKSTIVRALSDFVAKAGQAVKVIDFDQDQESTLEWNKVRVGLEHTPGIPVVVATSIEHLKTHLNGANVIIIDTPGRASRDTLEVALISHLVVQPTKGSRDDILPGVKLFEELIANGVPRDRLAFALARTDSEGEEKGARDYLTGLNFTVLPGSLPSRAGYNAAQNAGRSVLDTPYDSLNDKAQTLIEGLSKRLFAVNPTTGENTKDADAERRKSRPRPSRKEVAA